MLPFVQLEDCSEYLELVGNTHSKLKNLISITLSKRFDLNPFDYIDNKNIDGNNNLDVDENYYNYIACESHGYMETDDLSRTLVKFWK